MVSDDGTWTALTADTADNANAEMPRQIFLYDYGTYNFYAATAESGKYGEAGTPQDSLCPKGWNLSSSSVSTKSFYNLIVNSYGYISTGGRQEDEETNRLVRQHPLSFTSGYYGKGGALSPSVIAYWRSYASTTYGGVLYILDNYVSPADSFYKANSAPIRCVKE